MSLVLRTQKQTTPKASDSVTQSCHPTQQLMFDMFVALVLAHFRLTTLLSLGEGLFCVHLRPHQGFTPKENQEAIHRREMRSRQKQGGAC